MRKRKPVAQNSHVKITVGDTCLEDEDGLYFWIIIPITVFNSYFYLNFKKHFNEKALNSVSCLNTSLRIKMTNPLLEDLIEVIKMKCIYRFIELIFLVSYSIFKASSFT